VYLVRVAEGDGQTEHRVDVGAADYRRLSGGRISPEELLRRTFEFLLSREPKEAILRRFDLAVVSRYFPEFERAVRQQQPG
jgi:triphosphoribosyl-dephospho-CoA synthetase